MTATPEPDSRTCGSSIDIKFAYDERASANVCFERVVGEVVMRIKRFL
jgi:hypothetical protein